MADLRKHSSTSNMFRFVLKHSTTGQGLTGLGIASAGLIISTICDNEATATAYTAAGSTIETIAALGTFAAPTATKCRFKEVDATNHPGLYAFQFADARFSVASAKRMVITVTGATNLLTADYEVQLTLVDVYSATDFVSSVPAVTGAVGSVTGAVGSVTGNVGGNVTGSVASVTGAVGSVTGNVGGNVTGSVGSVAANGITAASIATDAITAAKIAADAIGASELAADAAVEIAAAVFTRTSLGAQVADSWGELFQNNINASISSRLAPTVAGRTLDVTTTGEAGVDWANVGSPTTVLALTNTTIATVTTVTNAPADSAGVTTLLTRLSALRAGYLDNLSAGAAALEASAQSVLSKLLKYFQLSLRKDAAIATDNATELTAINANGGSGVGAFVSTTDSQEAIRDNQSGGGGGGGMPSLS